MRMNVLIMENLFYDRRFSKVSGRYKRRMFALMYQIYDLKGSTRNRLIQPTGKINEVL
jgi:1-phosphatidylinositol-3-phosphate 5-kinase